MRESMGKDAVAAALAVGYRGAGTVEFIVDDKLQALLSGDEHALAGGAPGDRNDHRLLTWWSGNCAWQRANPCPHKQATSRSPATPSKRACMWKTPTPASPRKPAPCCGGNPNALHSAPCHAPGVGHGVRVDDGIAQGSVVSPYYDPMVAKIIVHGRDRDDAIRRLRAALANTPLLGLKNNGRFLSDLVDHPAFRKAEMTTTLIDQWLEQGEPLLQDPCRPMTSGAWPRWLSPCAMALAGVPTAWPPLICDCRPVRRFAACVCGRSAMVSGSES
jgi:geranyl-CoA carboxylase alpha subunit